MIEVANFIWIMGVSALGSIIWFIRLEARLIYLEKDHNKLVELSARSEMLFDKKIDKLSSDLSDIRVILGRIEGSFMQIDFLHGVKAKETR